MPDDRPRWWVPTVLATCVLLGVVLYLLVGNAGLQFDDFGNLRLAGELSPVDFVFNPVFDHFAPGHRLLTLLQRDLGPTNVQAMHAVLVTIEVIAVGAVLSILRRFYGARWWVPLLVVVPVLATVSLAVDQWFAAALHQVPALACTTWGIRSWIHHRDTGRRRWAIVAVALLTLALAFVGKALLGFGVVFLLDQLVLRPTPLRDVLPRIGREWVVWTLFAAPVVVYLLISSEAVTPLHPLADVPTLASAVRETWLTRFTPSLFGVDLPALDLATSATTAVQLGLQVALIGFVGWSLLRRPDSARALAILLAVVVVNATMIASSRVTTFGIVSANAHRYWMEPLWYASFLLPWAWTDPARVATWRVRPADEPSTGLSTDASTDTRTDPPTDASTDGGVPTSGRVHDVVGLVLLVVVLATTGVFVGVHQRRTVAFEARAWLDDLRATTALDGGVDLVDDTMPPAFSPPWGLQEMRYLLPGVEITGAASARLHDDGRLVEPDFQAFYGADGATFAGNTLVTFSGPREVVDGMLCTTGDLDADILLGPTDTRRFARLHLSGGRARVTYRPIDQAGPPGPTRYLFDTEQAGSTLLFPLEVTPIMAAGISVSAVSDQPACLAEVELGTIANAPELDEG